MENILTHKITLDTADIVAITELVHTYKATYTLDYKIDDDAYTSKQTEHLLYYQDKTLVAYMVLSCYDTTEMEVTAVTPQNSVIFAALHTLAQDISYNKKLQKIVFIVDQNDIFLQKQLAPLCGTHAYSEYRMSLDFPSFLPKVEGSLVLQKAFPEDYQKILQLDVEAFGSDTIELNAQALEDLQITTAAYLDDTLIGKARVHVHNGRAGIYGFVISPKYRGHGFGYQMITRMISQLITDGATYIFLEVNSMNAQALPLYEKISFKTFVRFDYYEMDVTSGM